MLAGPTALAFFSGGYFDGPRAWAGLLAWLAVVVAALAGAPLLPRDRAGRLAIAALAGLAAWTLLSMLWSPVVGDAYDAGQITMLYLGTLIAATALLRGEGAQRLVEPVLSAGALIVIGYGLSERVAPGLLHFARSVSAEGRLEQPLTYWNAMGELAALGLVLSARIAGDTGRAAWLRSSAAAAGVPLGIGLYISFSRGALFACAAGLIALTVVARRREQLWATLRTLAGAALGSLGVAFLKGFTSFQGSLGSRERQGLEALAVLVVVAGAAALAQHVSNRRERGEELPLPTRAGVLATGLIAAGLALAIVVGAHESSGSQPLSAGATRLTTLQSNRYAYWSVAFRAFASEPVHGVGAGGWAVDWLRWRHVHEAAEDAHSLPLQTLAELGVVGVLLLALFGAGVVWAGRRALSTRGVAAGPIAGVVTYFVHAPLDWDWQMPAVTLVAMILIGALLSIGADGAPAAGSEQWEPVGVGEAGLMTGDPVPDR